MIIDSYGIEYNYHDYVEKGDILLEINSVEINSLDDFNKEKSKYKVGDTYDGEVTKIMDYGCFVKIEDGIEGLIHNSELDWVNRNVNPNKIVSVSQKIKFKIGFITYLI